MSFNDFMILMLVLVIGFQGVLIALLFQQSKKQKNKFRSLVDSVPSTISWVNSDLRYIDANQKLIDLLGVESKEFLGKEVGFYQKNQEYLDFVKSIFKSSQSEMTFEFSVTTSEGKREILSIAKKLSGGSEAAIIGVDVTEIKEAQLIISDQQKALVAAAKLSSLGEMAAAIGHEINNPLSVIISYVELMEELLSTDDLDKEQIVQYGQKINDTAMRIARIVKGLKAFAREGSGDPLNEVPVSLIVDETLELCGQRLHNRGIQMKVNLEEGVKVECQKVQIQQVLLNLLNNAVDAIEKLPEKWLQIDAYIKEDRLVLSVMDSGSGIPSEIAKDILQPFYTTKGPDKGTGLGLSISQGIIKDHNGQFYIDSDCKNTRFVIEMPLKQPQSEDQDSHKAA